MPFRFKYFEVDDENSSLRVGTDAMLLGSWAKAENALQILDLGTGCGVLALMMAQKSLARITAIDLDFPSILEAEKNFIQSPWNDRLTAIHTSLQDFSLIPGQFFDFIISNPPFFAGYLKSPDHRKNSTRHEIGMSRNELIEGVTKLIKPNGKFLLILPASFESEFETKAENAGLYLSDYLAVSSIETFPPKRVLLEFTAGRISQVKKKHMFILTKERRFSEFYLHLTSEFHQF